MAIIVAVANQKGGVGKTFLVFHLAKYAWEKGRSVLVIDFDPQGNLSLCFQLYQKEKEIPCLAAQVFEAEVVTPLELDSNFYILSSDIRLARYEAMTSGVNIYFKLKKALNRWLEIHAIDMVLIDCPPSLGVFSLSAFVAAHKLLVPMRTEIFSVSGLGDLLNVVLEIKENINPNLEIEGLILNSVRERTRVARDTQKDLLETTTLPILAIIPQSIKAEEAIRLGKPVWEIAPSTRISQAIREGLENIIKRLEAQDA